MARRRVPGGSGRREGALVSAPQFVPAKREAIRLLVGVAGGTGSGKTYSAMRLAAGITGGDPFAVIDTEHDRAKMYADDFRFDHSSFEPPFTPARYLEQIQAADAAGYGVVVVDSASHEWAGEGGVLDMADAELERMGGRDAAKMASWIAPKREHKAFVRELIRLRAHVVLCFRAEPKIEMRKGDGGRWEIVPKPTLTGLDGWIPISEKNLPFELTCSFLLMPDAPGIPRPIKLPNRLSPFVDLSQPLSEETGAAIGAWALGNKTPAPRSKSAAPPARSESSPPATGPEDLERIQLELAELITRIPRETLPLRRIWQAVAEQRNVTVETLEQLYEANADRAWAPLRDSLTEDEARALLARLEAFETRRAIRLAAAGR